MFVIGVGFLLTLYCHGITNAKVSRWEEYRTTFSKDDPKDNPYAFSKRPIELDDAKKEGYQLMKNNENFKGDRYINGTDTANILIFDSTGDQRLVGFQIQWPESEIPKAFKPWFNRPFHVQEVRDGEIYFTATTYTVDPATIGKSKQKREDSKPAGYGLWLQIGPNAEPENILKLPDTTENMDKMWIRSKCVDRMGRHYVLNVTEDMDCKDFPPFTVIYIKEKLSAFTFLGLGNFKFSPRLEYPPNNGSIFFYNSPDCITKMYDDAGGVTIIHNYFYENPDKFQCPPDED